MDKLRITRKDLKKPDEFILFTTKAYHWAILHQMQIFYGLISLFIVVIVVVFLQNYRFKQESKASNILYEANLNMEEATKKKGSKPDDKDYNDLIKKSLDGYDLVLKKYPSSKSASFVHFYKGNLFFEDGKYKDAIESYQKALKSFKKEERTRGVILTNIAYSYEAMKNWNDACNYFKEASKIGHSPVKDIIYYNIGRCLSKLGNKGEAKKYFGMIASEYPNSKLMEKVNPVLMEGK